MEEEGGSESETLLSPFPRVRNPGNLEAEVCVATK